MIRHIVMWRLKPEIPEEEQQEKMEFVKKQLEGLKAKIPQIKKIEVNFNSPVAPASNHHIILTSEFNNFEALNLYQEHPDHKKAGANIKEFVSDRVAIDYAF